MSWYNNVIFPRNKALHPFSVAAVIIFLPCGLYLRVLGSKATVYIERYIATFVQFIQIFDYQRMLGSRRGLPPIKEVKYRPCRRGVYTVKQLTVKAFACFKAFLSAFRFTLAVYTQHICGIIPKKIRRNAGGTFHSCGQYFIHRHGLRLFAGNNLLELRDKAKQRAVLVNLQQIAYLHCVPAFARYFALLRQIFI